ncbi:hypothetical protein SKAU_G00288530 [Synaphobranchus kaupii]|uniref:Uncharacterized protein n=1 Tax=Synaphobranchus kaupii TaxID=118154 RepID=A0A9Q1ETC4_SYNKA|nr:hypothetical protein SKAU_G00288530 [Synaphobranchus kaupii]
MNRAVVRPAPLAFSKALGKPLAAGSDILRSELPPRSRHPRLGDALRPFVPRHRFQGDNETAGPLTRNQMKVSQPR